jgi:hypothetical protein
MGVIVLLNYFVFLALVTMTASAQESVFKGTLTLVISSTGLSCSGVIFLTHSELIVVALIRPTIDRTLHRHNPSKTVLH